MAQHIEAKVGKAAMVRLLLQRLCDRSVRVAEGLHWPLHPCHVPLWLAAQL